MLVFLPIGDEVARLPQEWFLNTPVLWLGALVLVSTIRGPLRNASMLIKKLLSLAAASLVALGLLVLLVLEPVIKASKAPPVFTALWILLLGLAPRSQCTSGTVRRSRRHGRGKGTNSTEFSVDSPLKTES